jgi:hypothetical protein
MITNKKKMFKNRCPSQTKDDNQKEVVINNKRWWLRGGGDLLEGDEKEYQHGHMSLIVHTNQKEREYNWKWVEHLNMNAWHHRGCAKNVTSWNFRVTQTTYCPWL